MSMSATRAALRQSSKLSSRITVRNQSTTTKAADAAKDAASKASSKASEFQSKASEGLSRVQSSAGPAIANAAKGVTGALSKIGGPVGRVVSVVEKQTPTVIYYSRVGLELAKLVFQGQKMSPPSISTFQSYYQSLLKAARNPSTLFAQASKTAEAAKPSSVLGSVQNISSAQLVSGAVVFAEVLGFFTVGEMIGRMKLIGYRGDTGAHH